MLSFGQISIQWIAEYVLLFLSALIRWIALSFLWITEPCSFTLVPCNHVSWWKPWHRHLKKQTLRYLCSYHRWWRILLTCYFKKVRFWDHSLKDPKIIYGCRTRVSPSAGRFETSWERFAKGLGLISARRRLALLKASYFPAGEESANNDLDNCLSYFLQALYQWEYQPLLCTSWPAVEEALKKLKRKKTRKIDSYKYCPTVSQSSHNWQ